MVESNPLPLGVDELRELGARLAAGSPEANELAIRRVVRAAWAAGLAGVALDVLADTTAPDVARLRAFAVVSARLAGRASQSATPDRQRPVA